MVKNKRGLVEKGQHKVQKMYLVSEKLSNLPCSDNMKRVVSQQGQVQLIKSQQDETHLKLPLSII
jgi:hypothetical protein